MSLPSAAPKNLNLKDASAEQLQKYCPEFKTYNRVPDNIFIPSSKNYFIVRVADCFKFKDILIISWLGHGKDIDKVFAKLLALHYVEYQNSNGIKSSVEFIDIKSKNHKSIIVEGERVWFAVYELKINEKSVKKD